MGGRATINVTLVLPGITYMESVCCYVHLYHHVSLQWQQPHTLEINQI